MCTGKYAHPEGRLRECVGMLLLLWNSLPTSSPTTKCTSLVPQKIEKKNMEEFILFLMGND